MIFTNTLVRATNFVVYCHLCPEVGRGALRDFMSDEPEYSQWIGRRVGGRFLIEGFIGRGGMGAVFRALDEKLGGKRAIKILHGAAADSGDLYQRIMDEAKLASQLNHAHVVKVDDCGLDSDGTAYMVMELLEGTDLEQQLPRFSRLPLRERIVQLQTLAEHVGQALQSAHGQGIVHLDITPRNIFLINRGLPAGMKFLAKVLDFGIARVRRAADEEVGQIRSRGNPFYVAPEIANQRSDVADQRTDEFSLAVVLYEAFSGHKPFEGATLEETLEAVRDAEPIPLGDRVRGLPAHIDAAIHRALSKDMAARYPTVQDFLDALLDRPSSVADDQPAQPQPIVVQTEDEQPSPKHASPAESKEAPAASDPSVEPEDSTENWTVRVVIAVAALGLVVGVLVAQRFFPKPPPPPPPLHDMSHPAADLTVSPDLTASRDLATPADLATPVDMAIALPDLARRPDMKIHLSPPPHPNPVVKPRQKWKDEDVQPFLKDPFSR